ncbi:S-DNA-T family DNA segregation ATPase FtsK/SpoIIIE [Novosphingobium sp. SG751A]|uniref:FtsK/SpoIIIE family DNA translocase n=1 Tax=Novosphingobium sp. SG751A TaxID=2587000 RepID=UPI001556BEF0|nr:DNA translocase FtsK 4TM domain-containing protein [Novosphingobium sp. SG751A]NOW45679.1 S-DNA-T family DNA segregation ATPase FtsK/SpoIIIE [Novosphingobium sp. SG751A]
MASRPIKHSGASWRLILRRSVLRSAELLGAGLLGLGAVLLAVALLTYHQTDPSASTASGGVVLNWLGRPGAFVADGALLMFGPMAGLAVPLLLIFARQLWLVAEAEDADEEEAVPLHQQYWLRPTAVLVLGMGLLASALSLGFGEHPGNLPASPGGIMGLLGAAAIRGVAGWLPDVAQGWAAGALGVLAFVGGIAAITRVFAIDWGWVLTMPLHFRRKHTDGEEAPAPARREKRQPKAMTPEAEAEAEDLPFTPDEPSAGPRKAPQISDSARLAKPAEMGSLAKQGDLFGTCELPGLDILADPPPNSAPKVDKLALERNAKLLETVLDDFNVKGEITGVRTGPVVTMYELEPAAGIKAARVVGLADDIARNMSAISARVSPVPGRTVMAIELPNADRQMVSFKELIASEKFVGAKGLLPMILGKDIAGEPIIVDLASMPHLLVAGTTGSGKSVGLNCILLSLLYRLTPQQCRMILVDPKVLELKSYEDIPHLLSPVVTEPAKAVRALKWAVEEMERRYRQMSEINVRNIVNFNEKVRSNAAKGKPLGRRISVGFDPETGEELYEDKQLDYEVLPLIVVIVDELADLMVTVGKEIEVLIQRLAQKSRAAGIHLIMATQRPSVDVITGVIKANLPTRISFAVTSRIDSRTILGEQGAEQLLGKGDMLFKPSSGPIVRVHGPFVSDEEVEHVADHWRAQGKPNYVDSVTEEPEEGSFGFDDLEATASDNPEERKYRQACHIVFESQKASTSWLQRQMGVGYNTAAKWIERMENDGLVGPANHVGRREVYRDKDGNVL